MKNIKRFFLFPLLSLAASCGGGGGGGNGDNGNAAPPTTVVSLAVVSGEDVAVEKSGQFAKFQVSRTGGAAELSIAFTLSGNPDSTKGSTSDTDFELHYSDGGAVDGTTLTLAAADSAYTGPLCQARNRRGELNPVC